MNEREAAMNRTANNYLIFLVLLAFSAVPGYGQYSIEWADFPDIGTATTYSVDTTGSVLVDLGSTGADITWDFSSLDLTGMQFPVEIVDASATEWADSFPTAEWSMQNRQWLSIPATPPLIPEEVKGLSTIDGYQRYDTGDNAVYSVGVYTETPLYTGGFPLAEASLYMPFPLELGTSWIRNTKFSGPVTVELTPGSPLTVNMTVSDSSSIEVDATGSIKLPLGLFECLRLKTVRYLSVIVQYSIFTIPVSQDTFIIYEWHTKDGGMVFQASSRSGETDPNFTEASTVVRMDQSTAVTSVEEDIVQNAPPSCFGLDPNYPNPFNGFTSIHYRLPETAHVELTVFNILGHRVRALESAVRSAGVHRIDWNGRDDNGRESPGGMYFYRLRAAPLSGGEKIVLTRKMLLSR